MPVMRGSVNQTDGKAQLRAVVHDERDVTEARAIEREMFTARPPLRWRVPAAARRDSRVRDVMWRVRAPDDGPRSGSTGRRSA